MAVISGGLALVRQISKPSHFKNGSAPVIGVIAAHYLSTLPITKNITLISKEKLPADLKQFRLSPQQDKPLAVMFCWLLSKSKHTNKYAEVYLNRGFHVLNINVTPWQLLWPVKGTQIVAKDTLKFLEANFAYSPLLLHGFSVGAYVWGEVMVNMATDLPKYQPLIDRVVGQVWDSAADITEIPAGLPKAVFPNNSVMEATLKQYVIYHMKTFHKVATRHYIRSSQMFHTTLVKAPAQFFLSKNDTVGAERSNMRVRESWESMGIPVDWQCWDKSPHVGHFNTHKTEYLSHWNAFLDKVLEGQMKMKAQATN